MSTGKGIGPEYLQNYLFTPFRQENSLASGSGLGLSIVRQAVGSLGGSIEINSTRGGGTEMTVRTMLTHHPASSPDASSFNSVFNSLRKHTEGKSMGLMGFGSSLRLKRDTTLYSSLERLCREWFGLSVTSVSQFQSSEQRSLDFYLAMQIELDNEDREGRNLFGPSQHPVDDSQGCGPRKLARALDLCIKRRLDQQAGHRGSAEEPTRWVEMPESSRLPLHIRPSDPPDERVKISKRPTADTMGSPEWVSRQHPSMDGTDPAAAGQRSSPPKEGAKELTTGKSVLLADDNDLSLQLLAAYTTKGDYDYMTAKNGVEAVETYKAQPRRFGVVVIDLSMPVMDGFEAARQIRRIEKEYHAKMSDFPRKELRPLIIAALTGLDSVDAQKEAFGSGVDTFLIKPVKRPELLSILQQLDK